MCQRIEINFEDGTTHTVSLSEAYGLMVDLYKMFHEAASDEGAEKPARSHGRRRKTKCAEGDDPAPVPATSMVEGVEELDGEAEGAEVASELEEPLETVLADASDAPIAEEIMPMEDVADVVVDEPPERELAEGEPEERYVDAAYIRTVLSEKLPPKQANMRARRLTDRMFRKGAPFAIRCDLCRRDGHNRSHFAHTGQHTALSISASSLERGREAFEGIPDEQILQDFQLICDAIHAK